MISLKRKMKRNELLLSSALWLFFLGGLEAFSIEENTTLKKNENPEICNTTECLQVADVFISSMNKSADPCVDFNEFACGRLSPLNSISKYAESPAESFELLSRMRVRDDLEKESTSEDILPVQQVKQWYKSCMDNKTRESRGLEQLNAILQETYGWPLIVSLNTWNRSATTWQKIDKYYGHLIGSYAFYHIRPNFFNHSQAEVYIPTLAQTVVGIGDGDELLYRSIIKNIAQLFIQQNKANVPDDQLDKDIDDLMKFEAKLSQAAWNFTSSDSYEKEMEAAANLSGFIEWWNNRTGSIATTPQGKIDWGDVFQGLYDIANLTAPGNLPISIWNICYLLDLVTILQSTDERTIVNYIQWKFLSKILRYTTHEVRDLIDETAHKYFGDTMERHPLWFECLEELRMQDADAYLTTHKYYNKNSREAASEIMNNLRNSLKMQIKNSKSLPLGAKRLAERRLDGLNVNITYTHQYENTRLFIDNHKDLTIGDDYISNHLNFMKHQKALSIIPFAGSHQDRSYIKNIMPEQDPTHYEIWKTLITSGTVFQTPLTDERIPAYIKYGILGTTIGYKLSELIDSADVPYIVDDDDLFANHFRGTSHKAFQNVSFSAERSSLTAGKATRSRDQFVFDKNLADLFGFSAAFRAYKKLIDEKKANEELKLPGLQEYTDEQMFYISYAQTWCSVEEPNLDEQRSHKSEAYNPPNRRVVSALSNSLAFTESFHCAKKLSNESRA